MTDKVYPFPSGLDSLLAHDNDAKQFFNRLPSYVQTILQRNQENIRSQHELERSAGNIIHGLNM